MKKKQSIELRYYEIPEDSSVIALLGERWVLHYGDDPMHFHNFMEIGYCYYGEGYMRFGDEKENYSGGTITIIPANFPHCTRSSGDDDSKWEYLYIDIEQFIQKSFADRPVYGNNIKKRISNAPLLVQGTDIPGAANVIRLMLDEMREKKEGYKESVKGYLMALLMEIMRVNSSREEELVHIKDVGNMSNIVDVVSYIDKHYVEEVRMSTLAKLGHMSESQLRRIFTACVNVPPMEYVNFVRIQKSCEALNKTDDSLDEVGRKCGFPVQETFIRNFKKVMGVSPGQWRSAQREKKGSLKNYTISIHKGW